MSAICCFIYETLLQFKITKKRSTGSENGHLNLLRNLFRFFMTEKKSQTHDTWRYSYRKREDFGLQLIKLVVARSLPANRRNARIVHRKPRVPALPCFCERPGLLVLAVFTCEI